MPAPSNFGIAEGIERFAELAQAAAKRTFTTKEHNGETLHIDEGGTVVERFDPKPTAIVLAHSVAGFCEAMNREVPGLVEDVIILCGHRKIEMNGRHKETGFNVGLIEATATDYHQSFFDRYHSVEDFVLKAQQLFVAAPSEGFDDDLARLLAIAGNMVAGESIETADDGVTQKVVVRRGIDTAMADNANPYVLWAHYGFPDVAPSARECILRIDSRTGNFGLFPVTNPVWAFEQANVVAKMLSDAGLDTMPIII